MSYLFYCALLTYLLQTSPLAAQTPDPKAVEHYRAGYHLLKAHNYRNAAIELEQATLIDTTYGQAFYALGKAFQVLNEYPKAIQAYKTASRLGIAQERIPTELTQLYYLAAIKLYSQRKYKEAVLNFDQSLQLEPDNAKAYYIKGLCYRSLRNLEAATKAFRRAVEANPQYAKPHKSLGDVSRRQRNYTPAAQAYEQAIALDSTYMEAYGGLALVHIETQDFEATVALLQKALSINPDYADGYLYLGTALNRLGRQHEAVQHAIMAFADNLGAVCASLNLEPGTGTTTTESKTNFLRPAPLGEKVTATSRLLNKGRTLMLFQAELRDTRDRLIAIVSQSQIVLRPR